MKALIAYLWCHRTKCLGFIQITLGALAVADGVFSPFALKLIILSSGVTTAWVGFFNSMAKKDTEDGAAADSAP